MRGYSTMVLIPKYIKKYLKEENEPCVCVGQSDR